MSENHKTERHGIEILVNYLRRAGRAVTRSNRKTFDLVVDGIPAEVKCKSLPWAKIDFVGLTDGQRRALDQKERFVLFIVCNVKMPDKEEIIEIPSELLSEVKFKVECMHYVYGSKLRSIANVVNF